MMTDNWKYVEDDVDGQTIALFRNEYGDEVEVRDTFPAEICLDRDLEDRYQVIYDPMNNVSTPVPGGRYGEKHDALEFAWKHVIDADVEFDSYEFLDGK